MPNRKKPFFQKTRPHSIAIVGIALGDEGKGRLIDNTVQRLLQKPSIKRVAVVRFQGGNNAGHTLEKNGTRLDLHLIPSSVLHKKAIGIMDRGMLIHLEDLKTEIEYVEQIAGSLDKRLFLSDDAILCTDLERAEEILNREKTGNAKGGTGRGVGPSYAHYYDRLGLKVYQVLDPKWKETLENYYDRYEKEFSTFGKKLSDVEVPDFLNSRKHKTSIKRRVGSKKEFLERLTKARNFLLKRNLTTNTFLLHAKIFADPSYAVVFEGAQAAGLDAWTGTHPDVTASDTTVFGVRGGTGFWRFDYIEKRIGVFKVPYTSSVGARRMPTHAENEWSEFVRKKAYEYGTTTGRPRDINYLDLAFLSYNTRMSGVNMFIVTHLDVARYDDKIKICTHYVDKKGNVVPYQPGLRFQKNVVPKYIELPSWDGELCYQASNKKQLPKNALKFLLFIEKSLGLPIIGATTGPSREHFIEL